jgi:hypothetical protein
MVFEKTLCTWSDCRLELETEYPNLANPSPNLKRSQVFLSSIDELGDEHNPYEILFCPSSLEEIQAFDNLLSTELSYQ